MPNNRPSELDGWDQIIADTTSVNAGRQATGRANTAHKLVLAIVNLQSAITSHQAKTANGLKDLTKSIDKFNVNSGKLATTGLWLSGAIGLAAIAQVVIAIRK
jgi:hypothetical protein